MGVVIGAILPLAVGVALSPLPIMAVILMLISARGQVNAIAFTVGWALGAFAVCAVVALLAGGATFVMPMANRPRLTAIVELFIGLATLALAVYQWRTRPVSGKEPKLPRWMQALDRLNVGTALGFGTVYAGGNVKNLPLIFAAATIIGAANIATSEQIVATTVFALLCTLGPGLPALVYLSGGDHAKKTLNEWKTWLELHNSAIMAVLLLFFGVKFLGDGLAGLF
jgi:hypothetical protein